MGWSADPFAVESAMAIRIAIADSTPDGDLARVPGEMIICWCPDPFAVESVMAIRIAIADSGLTE